MVDGHNVLPDMARSLQLSESDLRPVIEQAGFHELTKGAISSAAFWQEFNALTGQEVTEDLWGSLFKPTRRANMYQLVSSLKASVRVVAGTNTLDAHYDVHARQGDYDVFQVVYASNKLRAAKPDADFYKTILETEAVEPGDTVFIDDRLDNVEAARALGIHAIQFRSYRELINNLQRLNLQ